MANYGYQNGRNYGGNYNDAGSYGADDPLNISDDFLNMGVDDQYDGGYGYQGGRPTNNYDPYQRQNNARPTREPRRAVPQYVTDSYPRYQDNKVATRQGDPLYASPVNRNSSYMMAPPAIYTLDHLATFTISQKQRLLTPEDGVQQLRHMVATTGVWTMRVQIRIDSKEVVITEVSTQKEIESFPISYILNPVHIQSDNINDVYNNIVIFTVQTDHVGGRSEMNLFQCVGISGAEVVADINAARTGKFPRPKKPPVKEKPVTPRSPVASVDDRRSPYHDVATPPPPKEEENKRRSNPPEQNNVQRKAATPPPPVEDKPNENTQIKVEHLNSCFDEIESFVSRLQQAANADKEYDKQKAMGASQSDLDYLKQRSKAPSTKEFIGVFQLFKYAFNLLPPLKDILKDPNVDELVRTLFSPLSLVLESSKDKNGHYKLASSVVAPLLTLDACRLMDTSLQPKDIELWQSIGDSWIIPSSKWQGDPVKPYNPPFGAPNERPTSPGSSLGEADPQQKFLKELKDKNAKVCKVQTTRQANHPKS